MYIMDICERVLKKELANMRVYCVFLIESQIKNNKIKMYIQGLGYV